MSARETPGGDVEAIRLFGFRLNPMTAQEVIDQIAAAIAERRRLVMANLNVHAMAMMYESEPMARLLSQSDTLVMVDSMPLLIVANLMGRRIPRAKRTTSLDFYDDLFRVGAARGWRFAYVGGTDDALRRGLAELRRRFPAIRIDGHHGFFDVRDEGPDSVQDSLVRWLGAEAHDVVIVGMGMPRQEEWIARVQDRTQVPVFLPTGGYLDYQIGLQRRAPRWMGQVGLEWAYRLKTEPRRLSYRYLVEPLLLAGRLAFRRHPLAGRRDPGDDR